MKPTIATPSNPGQLNRSAKAGVPHTPRTLPGPWDEDPAADEEVLSVDDALFLAQDAVLVSCQRVAPEGGRVAAVGERQAVVVRPTAAAEESLFVGHGMTVPAWGGGRSQRRWTSGGGPAAAAADVGTLIQTCTT